MKTIVAFVWSLVLASVASSTFESNINRNVENTVKKQLIERQDHSRQIFSNFDFSILDKNLMERDRKIEELLLEIKGENKEINENNGAIKSKLNVLVQKMSDLSTDVKYINDKVDELISSNVEVEKTIVKTKIELIEELNVKTGNLESKITDKINVFDKGINNLIKEVSDVKSELKNVDSKINTINNLNGEIKSEVFEFKEFITEVKDIFPAQNCHQLQQRGEDVNGIRRVYLFRGWLDVVCDQQTDGGGWTVFQLRSNLTAREDFYRNWHNYSVGFGQLSGEFWMGLTNLNVMSKSTEMELRIEMEDSDGIKVFAVYDSFSVDNAREKFKLNVGSLIAGDAGDSFTFHNGGKFTTLDENNGDYPDNCARLEKGAWWYRSSCANSNLNGYQWVGNYSAPPWNGIYWQNFRGGKNSMAKTRMMFRPRAFKTNFKEISNQN